MISGVDDDLHITDFPCVHDFAIYLFLGLSVWCMTYHGMKNFWRGGKRARA